MVKNVQKNSDDGRYSCSAATNTGERSSQTVKVKVLGEYTKKRVYRVRESVRGRERGGGCVWGGLRK